jgi:hypothetical protein
VGAYLAGSALPEDHAKGVNIRLNGVPLVGHHLRRHVLKCPQAACKTEVRVASHQAMPDVIIQDIGTESINTLLADIGGMAQQDIAWHVKRSPYL